MVPDSESPVAALLLYLGAVNAILAVFNLLPGFPLDGGRVLRSIIWGRTGDLVRATNIVARIGQGVGFLLIGAGVYQMLNGNLFGGIWTAFIGWFLTTTAEASRQDVMTREMFREVRVDSVMDVDVHTVEPGTSVAELVDEQLLRQGQRAVPVRYGDRVLGIVSLTDVRRVGQDRWPATSVAEIMTREPLHVVAPSDDLTEALRLMTQYDIHQVLVMEGGNLVGMLNRAHVVEYMQRLQELGLFGSRRRR